MAEIVFLLNQTLTKHRYEEAKPSYYKYRYKEVKIHATLALLILSYMWLPSLRSREHGGQTQSLLFLGDKQKVCGAYNSSGPRLVVGGHCLGFRDVSMAS